MQPNDTNHDSLSIYFDFLEESGIDTSELRESLCENKIHYSFTQRNYDVGSNRNKVGGLIGGMVDNSVGFDKDVGAGGIVFRYVGTLNIGSNGVGDSPG